ALTEYEPRYYDVLGIGTYFGPKRIAWDTDVYDSSTGIHVATTGDDSTGDGSVGNPYLTISKGWDIAVAANGGTVWVHAGEYAENVSAGYFLKNAAAPSSTVTIRGVPGEKIIWTNTATGAYVFRLTGACSNITIRNVTFRQAYASGSGFVYCNDASNALSALQLIECHFDGAVNRATYFIQLVGAGGSSGVKVKRCSMTAAGTGMSTIFSNHVGLEVVGNSFVNTASATSWFGVRLNAGNSGNIYLNSNYMRGADGDGINQDTAFTGTAAVVARRNEVILTTGGDGLYLYGGSATYPATVDIRRNRITVPSGNGLVVVQAVSGGTMENNRVVAGADRVMNCGADGVGLEPVENVVVRHNHAIGQDAGTTHTLLIGPFSSGITADYNIVDGSDGAHYGLVFKGANSSFTDSIIYGGTDSALYLKGTDTCTVSRCLVVQNQSTVDATLEFQDGSALEPLVDSSVTECIFELTAGKLYGFGAGSTHLSTGNVINSNAYLLSGTATWGTMFASAVTSLAEVRASWAANYDVTTNDADSTDE
ncbi:MAG: hypothetical protein Q7Q73_06415, partial [Verrucomicrobiota bacterium JB024]|nr:hypothetical protein [Verrucomicrobiota bacterium JB024]